MELTLILRTSTILFVVTAVGGLIMAGISFKGHRQPRIWLSMLHGFLADAAVTLTVCGRDREVASKALAALVLLLAAATGGVVLNANYHWKKLPLHRWPVVAHALAAIVGFVLLPAAMGHAQHVVLDCRFGHPRRADLTVWWRSNSREWATTTSPRP